MKKTKIKKNDQVLVISGKDRGSKGKVLRVFPARELAIVERVNMVKRHTRQNAQKGIQGGVLEKEAPIHVSNVAHLDPKDRSPTKVGFKTVDGRKLRFARKSGEMIDR